MQKKLNLLKRQLYWYPDNLIDFPAFGKAAAMYIKVLCNC